MTAVVYPSAIARACALLDESPVFATLPDGYIKVVVRIIKKINLSRLSSAITASRGTLAAESGKSVETVGRVIKWLEERGLIQRFQKARAGLRGSSSPIVPTKLLLDALLLTQHKQESPNQRRVPGVEASIKDGRAAGMSPASYPQEAAGSTVTADASISVNPGKQSKEIQPGTASAFVRFGGIALPTDLAWLVREQGMSATGVLSLMKRARQINQRLSDVVTLTQKYLRVLKGRALFAYLRALLSKDRDYGYQAREDHKAHQDLQARKRLEEKSQALLGRRFQTRDGKTIISLETLGILTIFRNGRYFGEPISQAFLNALDDGRIVQIG